jgi:hypothetical protein
MVGVKMFVAAVTLMKGLALGVPTALPPSRFSKNPPSRCSSSSTYLQFW